MKKPLREDTPEPAQAGALEPEHGSFGSWLRRQREVRDITLREIADDSKISLRYLQALEEDRFDILPAQVFVKGFLRHYARYVGLDPEDVINYYLQARQTGQPSEQESEPRRRRAPRTAWRWGWLFVAMVAVLLGVVAVLSYLAEQRREAPPPAAAVPPVIEQAPPTPPPPPEAVDAPVAETAGATETTGTQTAGTQTTLEAPPEPVAAPRAPLLVSLQFDSECWVEVWVDGRRQRSETRVQGEAIELEAQNEVRLTLGDAGAVSIEVNGHPYALRSSRGQVLRDLRIDLALAEQLAAQPAPRRRS